jgi:hypothetical protein
MEGGAVKYAVVLPEISMGSPLEDLNAKAQRSAEGAKHLCCICIICLSFPRLLGD